MTNNLVIFDTSVFIDHLRTGCHQERIDTIVGLIRVSSVVIAELWRGATRQDERQFLKNLEKNLTILTPTTANWIESGQILSKIHADKGYGSAKLRDLHFDILIALTARSHGARLISSNRSDFELIRRYRDFLLELW